MALSYLIFGIILLCYLLIFQINDILFPRGMKPVNPLDSYLNIIYYLGFISIAIRILAVLGLFIYIHCNSEYEKALKENVLKCICPSMDNIFFLNDDGEIQKIVCEAKNNQQNHPENNISRSVNNAKSKYTVSTYEEKMFEETTIRVNMDELNEKIKAGEIFCDNNRSSRASVLGPYSLII